MIYRITSSQDATIYQRDTDIDRTGQNTGLDSILELNQERSSFGVGEGVFNSRILIKFENFSGSNLDLDTDPTAYWLRLYNTNADNKIAQEINIDIMPISQSWEMGIGEFNDDPITTVGVSWISRSVSEAWDTAGSDIINDSSYTATKSISYPDDGDLNVNVTNMVTKLWNAEVGDNYGFIIKRSGSEEISTSSLSALKFFSVDTNTIYQPRLEAMWDDSAWATGSLEAIDISGQISVWMHGLKRNYKSDEKARIRVYSIERYPAKSFATSSVTSMSTKYMPATSYYSIVDSHTGDVIIPFNTSYTKLSCDTTSNYFDLWMSQFEPLRYYRVLIKSTDSTSGIERIYSDSNKMFRVVK